jgi:hypothetical protein
MGMKERNDGEKVEFTASIRQTFFSNLFLEYSRMHYPLEACESMGQAWVVVVPGSPSAGTWRKGETVIP